LAAIHDAAVPSENCRVYATDPPYYDNVPYADLSDFFYIWLRRSLSGIYPDLFGTVLVPKARELVADPFRHGGRDASRRFFEEGMGQVFASIRASAYPGIPAAVFYAFKQSEDDTDDEEEDLSADAASESGRNGRSLRTSTGWETMLQGLIDAGIQITGTWPVRTERVARTRNLDSNALASSIVLVCHPRPVDVPMASRREFLTALKRELPDALRDLQHGNIAPVDLAQASIGPGMAVFSRYADVVEADGLPMRVRTALQLINQALDEVLAEQEGEFDSDTRWAIAWFDQYGMDEGPFGTAETLSKAKNTSVAGLSQAGLLTAKAGKVRLLRRDELPETWDPVTDARRTVWEVTQHLIRALEKLGEDGAAALLRRVGEQGEIARDLAYRLYSTCERKKWAQEALAYNSLVIAWPQIARLAHAAATAPDRQGELFG
jgi:putative DNA methylase